MNKKMRKTTWTLSVLLIFSLPVIYTNCSKFSATPGAADGGNSFTATPLPYSSPLSISGTESNVMRIDMSCGYVNEPCVSVTICQPGATLGSSACVTVGKILLDTGSFGLRVFSDRIPGTVSLPTVSDTHTGNPLAECQGYADGTSDWGPVVRADIYLGNGNERAPNVPMQVINASYPGRPNDCSNPDQYSLDSGNSNNVGFNGILGVGLFTSDCGPGCGQDSGNDLYFACASGTCTGAAVDENLQVSNPVSYITTQNSSGRLDNNGVIVQLPAIPETGATSLVGYMILGIGTQTDNTPTSHVTVFPADGYGEFQTYYNGQLFSDATSSSSGSYIDSGSNGLFFPDASLAQCHGTDAGYYCPSGNMDLTAYQIGANNSPQGLVTFQVTNADAALALSNPAIIFNNLAAYTTGFFDWGLPFFLGKTVYVGTSGANTTIGTGPFWGF